MMHRICPSTLCRWKIGWREFDGAGGIAEFQDRFF
jgi:hypothetical protein